MATAVLRAVVNADVGRASAQLATFGKQVDTFATRGSSSLSKFSRGASQVGSTLTKFVSLPLIGIAAASIKMAADFETSMAKISATSNTSAKNLARYRAEVLKLSTETARAPEELANAMYFLASAGLKPSQALQVLRASAKAAAAGMGEAADIAKLAANVLNAYAGSGLKAAKVTDILAAAIKVGSAEPDEFAKAMGRVLPIASKAGVSFAELAASLATMSNIGLDVNEGVTALRGLLNALEAPGTQAAKTMKDVGISADHMRNVISERGLLGALKLLQERTHGNIDEMSKIAPNIRALTGAFALSGNRAKDAAAAYEQVRHASGNVNEAFAKVSATSAFKFQQALTKLKVAAIELGTKLLPMATKVVDVAGRWLDKWNGLDASTKSLIMKIGGFAIIAGPAIKILGGLAGAAGRVGGMFGDTGRKKDAFARNLSGTLVPATQGATGTVGKLARGLGYAAVAFGTFELASGKSANAQKNYKAEVASAATMTHKGTLNQDLLNQAIARYPALQFQRDIRAVQEGIKQETDAHAAATAAARRQETAVAALTAKLLAVPKKVRTEILADADPAIAELAKYRAMLYSLPSSINTRLYVTPAPGSFPGNVGGSANGYMGSVNRPTLFLAGEAGPEHVTITPRSGEHRGGNHQSMSGGASHVHIYIDSQEVATAILRRELQRTGGR